MKNLGLTAAMAATLITSGAFAGELNSVGVIPGPLGNSFYTSLAAGAEAGVKDINPNAAVTVVSYENDLNKEFSLIESFVAAKVDMIVMVAADPDAVTPAIKKAQGAGIVVVGVDAAANAADANVVTDNHQGGVLACKYLAEKLEGTGNVALLNGPQVQGVLDRIAGCKESLAQFPGVEIVADEQGDGSRDEGFRIMQAFLTKFTDLDGVFSMNDPQAVGADLAAKQAGRSGLTIVGFDGGPEIIAALKEDTQVVASAAQDPWTLGFKAVQVGKGILDGNPPAEKKILAPTGLVTRENVAEYPGWRN